MTVNTKKVEWEKENMRTVSCRLRKEEAERFKQYATYLGTTSHALLAGYVKRCLENGQNITQDMVDDSQRMQNEIALLRRKLSIANEAVDQARARALNAEALVDKWLRSADNQK